LDIHPHDSASSRPAPRSFVQVVALLSAAVIGLTLAVIPVVKFEDVTDTIGKGRIEITYHNGGSKQLLRGYFSPSRISLTSTGLYQLLEKHVDDLCEKSNLRPLLISYKNKGNEQVKCYVQAWDKEKKLSSIHLYVEDMKENGGKRGDSRRNNDRRIAIKMRYIYVVDGKEVIATTEGKPVIVHPRWTVRHFLTFTRLHRYGTVAGAVVSDMVHTRLPTIHDFTGHTTGLVLEWNSKMLEQNKTFRQQKVTSTDVLTLRETNPSRNLTFAPHIFSPLEQMLTIYYSD